MDLMDLMAERVKILHENVWREREIKIVEDRRFIPEITEEMKKVARKNFAQKKKKNPKHFDGDIFHLNVESSLIEQNKVILAVGKIKYSLYDIARKENAEKYGWKQLPSGMGTAAVVLSSDSKIIMHKRLPHVDHKAKISTIGGLYDKGHPFANIREELWQELRLKKAEIEKLLLLAIYTRFDERLNHGLAFLVKTCLSSKEILKREKTIPKDEREGKIFFLEKDPETLRSYLKKNHRKILSDGFVNLVTAGHYLWGKNWSTV